MRVQEIVHFKTSLVCPCSQNHFQSCLGLQNRVFRGCIRGVPTVYTCVSRREGTHRPTSSYTSTKAFQQLRSIHKTFVYGSPPPPKEGGAHRPVVSLKGSKSLCRILTCQDGRCINAQGFDQNRPANGSNLDSTPEISPLYWAGQSLGVFMSFLWAKKCLRVFTSGIPVEKDGDKTNHLH